MVDNQDRGLVDDRFGVIGVRREVELQDAAGRPFVGDQMHVRLRLRDGGGEPIEGFMQVDRELRARMGGEAYLHAELDKFLLAILESLTVALPLEAAAESYRQARSWPTIAEQAGVCGLEIDCLEGIVRRLYGTLAGKFAADALREMREPYVAPPTPAEVKGDNASDNQGRPLSFVAFDDLVGDPRDRRMRCLELASKGREGWADTAETLRIADQLFRYVDAGALPEEPGK